MLDSDGCMRDLEDAGQMASEMAAAQAETRTKLEEQAAICVQARVPCSFIVCEVGHILGTPYIYTHHHRVWAKTKAENGWCIPFPGVHLSSLHIHQEMVYTSYALILSWPKLGGCVYISVYGVPIFGLIGCG